MYKKERIENVLRNERIKNSTEQKFHMTDTYLGTMRLSFLICYFSYKKTTSEEWKMKNRKDY